MSILGSKPKVSLVIPVYNEEGNLAPLLQSITAACETISYEVIVVDDGSSDGTPQEIDRLLKKIPHVRVLTLKQNFGQTAAMAAGIDAAKGEVIIPLDGDGQNDPSDIANLLKKFDEGYDVVSGWRKDRQDALISRKFPSWMANSLISHVTGVHLHDYGCTLKAYRSSLIKNIQLSGEMHRFLPAWCSWRGARVAEIPVQHHSRKIGQSKYGLLRIFKVIIDLMTIKFFSGYLAKPNYLFSGSGMILFAMSLVSGSVAVIDKFGPNLFPSYRLPLLLLAVFLGLLAVAMVFLGLLAELLVRLYFAVRNQKPYVIADEKSS